MLLKLIPDKTTIPFTRVRMIAIAVSVVAFIASIVGIATVGLNFGVDFRGGVTIEVTDDKPIDIAAVRAAVTALGVGEVKVQAIQDFAGSAEGVVVFVGRQTDAATIEGERAQQAASDRVRGALSDLLGEGIVFRKIDVVGPTVSGELVQRGILAVTLAIGMMLAYITFRFEWQFGAGAIIALFHDVVITLGVLTLTRLDFSLAVIAALLTIVGYSVNDTVIVYDRVRENLRKYKKMDLAELLDLSINDTLTRTIMTSGTTLLALGALAIFGGEVLRGFTLTIIFGILIGTYSSIFIAAPVLLATGVTRDPSKTAATAAP